VEAAESKQDKRKIMTNLQLAGITFLAFLLSWYVFKDRIGEVKADLNTQTHRMEHRISQLEDRIGQMDDRIYELRRRVDTMTGA
jgi:peptidoglycan hydrolase CwlO-like protein